MSKIDCVYVVCNKQDFYFAKICFASIRYWNKSIPIQLIKDYSKGNFDTSEVKLIPGVTTLNTSIKNLGYFAKLYPLIEKKDERVLILDADIVWLCDLIPILECLEEDIVVDGYFPDDVEVEKLRWYFSEPAFSSHFPKYAFPGFFFNVGQMLISTKAFSREEFLELIHWNEFPSAKISNAFFHEQGILNFLTAKKIQTETASVQNFNFHLWGWDERIQSITTSDLEEKKEYPYLVHWYGVKNGLTSFLPGNAILKFYEKIYYEFLPSPKLSLFKVRFKRTLMRLDKFCYEIAKRTLLAFYKKKNK